MTALDDLLARGRRRGTFPFAVGDSVLQVEFEALKPSEYEALSQAHLAEDGGQDPATFLPALASACAVEDNDLDKWTTLLTDGVSAGEANALYQRLLVLNYGTVPAEALGKD